MARKLTVKEEKTEKQNGTFVTTAYIPVEIDQAFRLCPIGVNARVWPKAKRTL